MMQSREGGFNMMKAHDWLWLPPDISKSQTVWAVTDPLDDGERLLIHRNLFPVVPGDPGHVPITWLEDVWGHVHQVNTWHQHNTEQSTESKWSQHASAMHPWCLCFCEFLFNLGVMECKLRTFPLPLNGNLTFLSVAKAKIWNIYYYFVWMTGYQPAVNIFPAPDITTTLQSGSSAISLKRVTISLTWGKKNFCSVSWERKQGGI